MLGSGVLQRRATMDEGDTAMRTMMVAIVLLVAAGSPAFADARVLEVDEVSPPAAAPATDSTPAPTAEPQPTGPATESQASPAPAVREPPGQTARFRFEPVRDGFLRLDRQTGQVALCSARPAGWACEAVPEERTALENEIARLQDEVSSLRREVASLREPPAPPRPPADLAPRPPAREGDKGGELTLKMPTQDDVDRATAALQRAWDRVLDMIGQLKSDLTRKAPDRTTL